MPHKREGASSISNSVLHPVSLFAHVQVRFNYHNVLTGTKIS